MINLLDRQHCIDLIHEATASGATLNKACRVLEVHPKTYRRWFIKGTVLEDGRPKAKRPTPGNKLTWAERELIVTTSNEDQYKALPPSQIVPKALSPQKRSKPTSDLASRPNEIWSWDITFLKSNMAGWFYRLYMLIDIDRRKIVGWEVHETESADFAAALINRACLAEGTCRTELVLHSDNGAPMKGATMLAKLQWLGVVPSFSRPSVSNDNPYSESLFKTLKYTPAYPEKPSESLQAARDWVYLFVHWYNEEHGHSGIQFVTPGSRHRGEDIAILAAREAVYIAAKAKHPERWSKEIKCLQPVCGIWLNPDQESRNDDKTEKRVA